MTEQDSCIKILMYKKLGLKEEGKVMNNDRMTDNIKDLIMESGMKQKVVAERAGFTEQMMTDMLNGRKVIKAEFIPAFCRALGVTPNRLFRWDERGA